MDSVKHTLQTRVKKVPVLQVPERAMVTPSNLSKFKTVEIESERDVVPDIPVAMRSNLSEFETVEIERDVAPKMSVVPIPYASEFKTIEIESERDDVERDDGMSSSSSTPPIPYQLHSELTFSVVEAAIVLALIFIQMCSIISVA